jgi:phosphoserine phosphatase RsbU/P
MVFIIKMYFTIPLLGFWGQALRVHRLVGARRRFSTSRQQISAKIVAGILSIPRLEDRLSHRGAKMTSDAFVVDVTQDWEIACDVQQRFMHYFGVATETLSYSARCRQVRALGGDFYDFMPLPDNRLALAVGDASGKGLAAALMMSNVQSSLRTAASFTGNDGPSVVTAVNRQVYASSLEDRFATLFYGVFDGATRKLQYVNAGQNPPMVIRRDGSIIYLDAGGAPVGIFANSTYEHGTVQLVPGDLILAYTDGVSEAISPAGSEWGVEGLREAATKSNAQCVDEIAGAIFASMDEFSGGRQTDDATIVVVRVC